VKCVQQIGRLTADPEPIKITDAGPVTSFRIAVPRPKTADREADFFAVEVWQRLAHTCAAHLQKGREVAVEGRLDQRQWRADDGTSHKRVVIVARRVSLRRPAAAQARSAVVLDDTIRF
jgi:single-strand DNA-binding protein